MCLFGLYVVGLQRVDGVVISSTFCKFRVVFTALSTYPQGHWGEHRICHKHFLLFSLFRSIL